MGHDDNGLAPVLLCDLPVEGVYARLNVPFALAARQDRVSAFLVPGPQLSGVAVLDLTYGEALPLAAVYLPERCRELRVDPERGSYDACGLRSAGQVA